MLKGFRDFIMRGNVVDLAVAVVIGAAFGAVITAFVADIITPLIAAIFGKPDFSGMYFRINGSRFLYGSFINAVISFLLIAAAIYFVVVVPMNKLAERRARGQAPTDATTKLCPECLSEIPIEAKRCAFCTTQLTPTSAG
jgi:large conductance mechanosensitive channel